MGIIKPSVSFLPMNDIAGYLVENNKMATEEYVDKALDHTKESLTQCIPGDTTTAINSSKLVTTIPPSGKLSSSVNT